MRRIHGIVSTDDILPARYKHASTDPETLAQHVFEYRLGAGHPRFAADDCIVADDVFGIGSSREQAVSALVAAGVRAVIAPAFGRIFYRNCWNLALPAIEADLAGCAENDPIELRLREGRIVARAGTVPFAPPPERLIGICRDGGLLRYVARRSGQEALHRAGGGA